MGPSASGSGPSRRSPWASLLSLGLALACCWWSSAGRRHRRREVLAEVALARAVLGTFIVFTITVVSPRIGTTATIALLVTGQLAAGTAIDRYGLFGFERIALSLPRALGIALLARAPR